MDMSQNGVADRAKKILLTPKVEWPVIDAEPATIGGIYTRYVLILAAIPAIAGLIGNLLFGIAVLGITVSLSPISVISGAITQYILSLISVFVLGIIIDMLAPTFGGTKNPVQAFKVAAYSYTAGWVAGILMIFPQLAVIAALLGLYGFYLLYLGLPLLMRAPQDKALSYTVVTVIAAIVLGIVVSVLIGMTGRLFAPPLADASVSGKITVPGGGTIDLGQLGAAAKQAEIAAAQVKIDGNGNAIAAVSPSALQALLPPVLDGYKRTETSSSGASAGGMGGAHAEARYEKDENSINLGLTDMGAAGAIAALGGAMNVQANRETENGYERTRTENGRMVSEKWDRSSGRGSYSELVSNRFMISAEGKVADIAELKRAAGRISADQLATLVN